MGRWSIVSEDRAVGNGRQRQDLVLKKNRDLLILDITVPFENGADAFDVARKTKEDKYRQLAIDLSENMTSDCCRRPGFLGPQE